MTGRTHLLIGLDALWLLSPLPAFRASLTPAALGAALGSLLPDLDAPHSLLQTFTVAGVRPFGIPARAVSPYGHRGLLHSLAGLALVAALASPLAVMDPFAWMGLVAGHASHLLADSATKGGIRLFYPKTRRYHVLPRMLRLTTGSPAEDLVFALAASGLLFLLVPPLLR